MDNDSENQPMIYVDEKETCTANFVPEKDFKKIWENDSDNGGRDCMKMDKDFDYYFPMAMRNARRSSDHPLFRRRINTIDEESNDAEDDAVVQKSDEELGEKKGSDDEDDDGLVGAISSSFNEAKKTVTFCLDDKPLRDDLAARAEFLKEALENGLISLIVNGFYAFYIMVLCLGSKWTWNIATVVAKVMLAVFIYLVLATATVLVAILLNVHEAYANTADDEEELEFNLEPPNLDHNLTSKAASTCSATSMIPFEECQ